MPVLIILLIKYDKKNFADSFLLPGFARAICPIAFSGSSVEVQLQISRGVYWEASEFLILFGKKSTLSPLLHFLNRITNHL